jgi:hypothetical protein
MCYSDLDIRTHLYGKCTKQDLQPFAHNFSVPTSSWVIPEVNKTALSNSTYPFNLTTEDYYYIADSGSNDLFIHKYASNPSVWRNSSWTAFLQAGNVCASAWENASGFSTSQFQVDYCLSQKIDEKCQLIFSLPICLTVIICNIVKVSCMFLTAHDKRKEIFLTIGDALSSFLSKPDPTTKGRCLLSASNITKSSQPWKASIDKDGDDRQTLPSTQLLPGEPDALQSAKKRWIQAVSISHWIGTVSLFVNLIQIIVFLLFFFSDASRCLLLLSASSFLLWMGIDGLSGEGSASTLSGLWNLGFGDVSSLTMINTCSDDEYNCEGLISTVLLANTPQILVSIAYFLYNSTLTTMLLAAE